MATKEEDEALNKLLEERLGQKLEAGPQDFSNILKQKKAIEGRLDILSSPDTGRKTEHIIGVAQGLGENDLANALLAGTGSGGHSQETFDAARDRLIGVANRQLKDVAARELNQRKAQLKFEEEQYGRDVLRLQPQVEQAIDKRLNQVLGDIGYRADTSREQLGAALADRGIDRSSFGAGQVQNVYQAEQEEKAQQRLTSDLQKTSVQRNVSQVFDDIKKQRANRELSQNLAELKSASEFVFNLDYTDLQRKIESDINALDDGSGAGALIGSIAGGAIGGIAGAFLGGPAGAAAGVAGGSAIGGGVGGAVS